MKIRAHANFVVTVDPVGNCFHFIRRGGKARTRSEPSNDVQTDAVAVGAIVGQASGNPLVRLWFDPDKVRGKQ
jgi:hypothetical protein